MFSFLRKTPVRGISNSMGYSRKTGYRLRKVSSKSLLEQKFAAAEPVLPGSYEVLITEPITKSADTKVLDNKSHMNCGSAELVQNSVADNSAESHAQVEAQKLPEAVIDVNTYKEIDSPPVNHESELKTSLEHSSLEAKTDAEERGVALPKKDSGNTEDKTNDAESSEKSDGRSFQNIPRNLAKRIRGMIEWLREFKKDWDQMIAASEPMEDSPEWHKEQVTFKK